MGQYRSAGALPITAFFSKYCISCHSDAKRIANLTLEQPPSNNVWEKILDRVSSGRMPPPGSPSPSKADRAAVNEWITARLGHVSGDPGRVTAHRLNRVEYNNTVRDLLGVSLRPADEFPLDDAGYGFDNIGDVLSVSPLLMEKYISAARQLSRVSIYGESYPKQPAKLVRFLSKKSQDDPTPSALPYSYRGAIYGTFRFPVDGEYELRMRDANYRPRDVATPRQQALRNKRGLTAEEQHEYEELNRTAYPAVKMVTTFDGVEVLSEIVEGNIDYKYAHGEAVARVKATAGEHVFRASFPEFSTAASPAFLDPHFNLNLDGRRKLFIDYIDIVGPFHPSTAPPQSRKRIFVCAEDTSGCTRRIIETLARRAFRRPLLDHEAEPLVSLAASVRKNGDSFDESIRVVLQALLLSPNFLFRIEREPPGVAAFPLSDHELAARLSYFLWSTMPDETLTRAADEGRLRQKEAWDAQVRRMLTDPRADALVENFFGQWLGLRILDRRKPDPARFPYVDDELLDAMHRETMLFAKAIVREDRSILDLIDARFTYVNGPLAAYYGIDGVSGEAFQRVDVDGVKRGGILTQGSILTLSSYATRTSPVLRGKWVLETLLGTPPPPPPPDVPALVETSLGKDVSLRQRMEQHRAIPSCAVCHTQMDAIGFGLENYDAAGAWRTHDGKFPVDASGKLPGAGEFHSPSELRRILKKQSALFVQNVIEKLMTYALGRGTEASDRATVNQIAERAAVDGYRFSTLVRAITESAPFQMQRANGGEHGTR